MRIAPLEGMTLPWWGTLIATTLALMLAAEAGFRIAARSDAGLAAKQKSPVGVVVAAMLALLGLLLGFTFSMVDSRFDARRALVLADANAISTTFLRAEMVPTPHGANVRALLREYVGLRLDAATSSDLSRALERSATLHDELWTEAVAVAALEPQAQTTNLFVTSLNEMFDLHESRVTVALYQRMPGPVKYVLYTAALLALGAVGFSVGLEGARAGLATGALVLAVASVMTLILELDRPLGSLVGVNEHSMRDVAEMMEEES